MVHISEITSEKRLNHPQDMLKLGQQVTAQVLAIDKEKRQLRLSIKQAIPTGLDDFLAEHKPGDVVTGRVTESSNAVASVELGEGVHATCRITAAQPSEASTPQSKADLSSLTSMLQARWKDGAVTPASKSGSLRAGQISSFRITKLDAASKEIELELVK